MKKVLVLVVLAAAVGIAGYTWTRREVATAPTHLVLHGNVDIRQVSLAFAEPNSPSSAWARASSPRAVTAG